MKIRELPWSNGRFFEIDACNVVQQPEPAFIYLTLICHCHDTPRIHISDIAKEFNLQSYYVVAPFDTKWIHIIEGTAAGTALSRALTVV